MIDYKNISVVISGPIFHDKLPKGPSEATAVSCRSVRKQLPGAEIVLSTWKGEFVDGLDYDKVVFSEDPGSNISNVNRQICSRRAGIEASSGEYILAIRSESYIKNVNFLSCIDKYELHSGERQYEFVRHRIVIAAATPPRCELFHMGDFYFFGHRDDLLSFWTIPYMIDKNYNKEPDDILYNAHRYLITSFIRKYIPLNFYKKTDITKENRNIYEKVLAENFVITGLHDFGCRSLKYPIQDSFKGRLWHYYVSYTFAEWQKLYNRICGLFSKSW